MSDNSNIELKRIVRREASRDFDEVHVLDAYAGKGRVWQKLPHASYFGIEKARGKSSDPRVVRADNRALLGQLDLSRFNVIDLDAYGLPMRQVELVAANPSLSQGTAVVLTFCVKVTDFVLPSALLKVYGIPAKKYKEAEYLFAGQAKTMFLAALNALGVTRLHGLCLKRPGETIERYYVYFKVGEDANFIRSSGARS